MRRMWHLVILGAICGACGRAPAPTSTASAVPQDADGRSARLVSAFLGLDDSLPRKANLLCLGAAGQDGMPVVLSHVIDGRTLERGDFVVVTQAGVEHMPSCVTLAPAVGVGELRTVLLVGDLGSAADPPVVVRVVGDILSDGPRGAAVNFRGAEARVIPLERGPTLVWAEDVPRADWFDSRRNGGTHCPERTTQVVRATWAGGIRLPGGNEVGDAERALYRVIVQQPDGKRSEVVPFALADLDDNDNNHSLCLDVGGTVMSVAFPAGHVVDPNGDLNPDTEVAVTPSTVNAANKAARK